MDVLSEVLKTIHLQGALFFNGRFSAPWQIASPASASVASVLAPGAERVIIFHFLTEGRAYARVEGSREIPLAAGDLLICPHGDAHTMGNGKAREVLDSGRELPRILARELKEMTYGGGGDKTHFICGFMACDPLMIQPVLAGLPPLIKISIRGHASGQWLEESIRFSLREAELSSAGSGALLSRLAEVLFVEAIRHFVESLPPQEKGWLAGARDPAVGHSLMLLHQSPAHSWTIAELARKTGVSRSTLAERFAHYLGEPPMTYLAGWRMRLAAKALATSSRSVLEIAIAVGYDSEAAFSRAFKRHFRCPPAQYRKQARTAVARAARKNKSGSSVAAVAAAAAM